MLTSAQTYDVAIAGNGPAGSSAAFKLAKNGLNVILIEKSSLATTGIANPVVSKVELHCVNIWNNRFGFINIIIIFRRVYKRRWKPSYDRK